jgi:hypothetical protein
MGTGTGGTFGAHAPTVPPVPVPIGTTRKIAKKYFPCFCKGSIFVIHRISWFHHPEVYLYPDDL